MLAPAPSSAARVRRTRSARAPGVRTRTTLCPASRPRGQRPGQGTPPPCRSCGPPPPAAHPVLQVGGPADSRSFRSARAASERPTTGPAPSASPRASARTAATRASARFAGSAHALRRRGHGVDHRLAQLTDRGGVRREHHGRDQPGQQHDGEQPERPGPGRPAVERRRRRTASTNLSPSRSRVRKALGMSARSGRRARPAWGASPTPTMSVGPWRRPGAARRPRWTRRSRRPAGSTPACSSAVQAGGGAVPVGA